MMAFPEGSKNNALTGFDSKTRDAEHNTYFGNRDPEAYLDFSMPAGSGPRRGSVNPGDPEMTSEYRPERDIRPNSKRTQSFDPINRAPVHGSESLGLGTSTFLEGAPAAKRSIQMAVTEEERPESASGMNAGITGGGLQRKKSLVQKIRSMSQNRNGSTTGPPPVDSSIPIPDRRNKQRSPSTPGEIDVPRGPFTPSSPPVVNRSTKASVQLNDVPYDDYDTAWDRKEEDISAVAQEQSTRERVSSSPRKRQPNVSRAGSEGRVPTMGSLGEPPSGGGLLKRVKSLSKGKRRDPLI